MSVKTEVKWFFEKVTGVHLYRKVPRGIDLFDDLTRHLPTLRVKVVFDVGANTGQSAKSYLNKFPACKIYSFEPVESTFRKLQQNVRDYPNVMTFKLAFGARAGAGTMVLEGNSDMFFLADVSAPAHSAVEHVTLETLDTFCEKHAVAHIDYLKIDTEGQDLSVLFGAARMLAHQHIDLVEVEAGMNAANKRHVPFETLKSFLEEKGYLLFGIYEQVEEWPTNEPHLRRSNPVFISPKLIKANASIPNFVA